MKTGAWIQKVFAFVAMGMFMGLGDGASAQTEDLPGCTNPAALNYNPEATVDDGTCLGVGCPDPEAINFDPFAIFFGGGDESVCEYPDEADYGCTDALADNYDSEAVYNDGSCVYSNLPGCTDDSAWNYNPMATEDDGSCVQAGCPDPAALNFDPITVFFGTGDDSVCEYPEDGITGCTNPAALNYNPAADTDDGSCFFPDIAGCTDGSAWNYNPMATQDDGSCFGLGTGSGCGDPMALNYNPFFFLSGSAGAEDCTYGEGVMPSVVEGCTDPAAANFNPVATDDNGSCVYLLLGCTDPMALNYNPLAVMDDGSCMAGEDVMETAEWEGLEAVLVLEDSATGWATYRLYGVFNDPGIEVVTVFGDVNQPLEIVPLEGAFVQDAVGATFADDLGALAPADDSWLAIGEGDDLTYVGPNLAPFADAGASVIFNDAVGGAWFRVPGSGVAGQPDAEGRVLLGQFTHAGAASALLNLQYFDAAGLPRQVHGATLTWPSTDEDTTSGDDLGDPPAGCSGDLDNDGLVSVNDLLELISQFGVLCE